ncbi:MAG: hypothetical protein SGILL_002967 [Bacillariaceae sp.]
MEDVTRKLKRGAAELDIDLIDLKTPAEEEEFLQHCKLPSDLGTKGKLRRLIREEQKPPVFLVSAVVKGALRSQGARGNVYKALEKNHGLFSKSAGMQIAYSADDLVVKAYFGTNGEAMSFQTALNEWELHKTLMLLDGVEIDPPDPVAVHRPQDLSRFYLQYYQPNESESPCQTLNQLESYRLSDLITEAVEPSDPVAIYQSLDVCVGRNKPYKCHLKDKAKYKSVARNPNNVLAASWPLHQMLDGLNHYENMSVIKLSISSVSDTTIATQDNRSSVTLQLEFFNKVDAAAFQARQGARQVDERTWQTTVYVKDKDEFAVFVDWKGDDTQRQWDDYNIELRDM